MKIYHNPRCQKSRATLQLLEENGQQPEVVQYLETPPAPEELRDVLHKLGKKPEQIIRKQEPVFKEKYKGQKLSDEAWLRAIRENPKLLERPIVVRGNEAVIGRPPEKVLELL